MLLFGVVCLPYCRSRSARGFSCVSGLLEMRTLTTFVALLTVAASAAIAAPTQGHLSLLENGRGMRVMWVSSNATEGYVKYGVSRDRLTLKSKPATSETYTIDDMCGAPANESKNWVDPGNIFSAELTSLQNGQVYYYQFGDGEDNNSFSPVYSFHFGPKSNITTSFLAYGDMGVGAENDRNSTAEILAHVDDVDVVVHVGDVSYAVGHAKKWADWFEEIEPVATRVPYHVCLGNHEYDWPTQSFKPWYFSYRHDSGGECGIPYDKRFKMPGPPFRSKDVLSGSTNIYHSINVGLVHIVMISSEHDMSPGSEQFVWLEQDLERVDRKVTPWVVFGQHRPFYGSTVVRALPEYGKMKAWFEPLFLKYKVDLVLFGHIHQYQRTCRMKNYVCDDDGPVYMVVGTAGATTQVPFLPTLHHWIKFRSDNFGISKFKAYNASHMHVNWYLDRNGTIGDSFWIVR